MLTRKNGQWSARAGREIVLDDTPEQALHRLMLRLQMATGDLAEQKKLRQLCDCQRAPSCDLSDFQIQPDVDGHVAYRVHFTSNVKLHRGDFEKLFCQCVRREDLHDSAQYQ